MPVGNDALNDARFANLDANAIIELCGSLADYGEAGGLSRELMLQVGRYAEGRYIDDLEVLLAVSRMYLLGGEAARAKVALMRAGKLGQDEARVLPLLDHVLKLLGDPRSAEQALDEAPESLSPFSMPPPPMPSVPPPQPDPETPAAARQTTPKRSRSSGPASAAADRQTTPKPSGSGASRQTTPKRSTTPSHAHPTTKIPRQPGGVAARAHAPEERAVAKRVDVRTEISRRVVPKETPEVEPLPEPGEPRQEDADRRSALEERSARERSPTPAGKRPVAAPDTGPGMGRRRPGVARTTRIRLLDPDDEGRRLDPYELIGELAAGGMATVFLARLAGAGGFQRFVAIKRLHPHLAREQQFVDMFLDEARIAAGIHNPHVVPILEVGENASGYYVVMELIEGDTLSGLTIRSLQRGARVPAPVALRIVFDALTGLHAAHQLTDAEGQLLGLVHRDCTPQNILVGVDGSARITDFGVARAASRLAITRPQQVKGKVGYLSPEQAHAQEIDRRSDVFTMGIVLWEALAGRPLFQADNEGATLTRLISSPIPAVRAFVPDTPAALDDVCRRALQRDRNRRFRTAAEMAEAIERAAAAGDFGGMATPRELGQFVESVVGVELAAQREAVRGWLAGNEGSPLSRAGASAARARARALGAHQEDAGDEPPQEAERTSEPEGRGASGGKRSTPIPEKAPRISAQRAVMVPTEPAAIDATSEAAAAGSGEETRPAASDDHEPREARATPAELTAPAPGKKPSTSPITLLRERVSALTSARMSTTRGIALVAILVIAATAPVWLKKANQLRHARAAPTARTASTASAKGPRRPAQQSTVSWDEQPLPPGFAAPDTTGAPAPKPPAATPEADE